ncbi:MAG: hypothetical protein IH587_10045 [Anaerolineae bacterium]|nr:hypothetical protein [Anaerolineae bacterium]
MITVTVDGTLRELTSLKSFVEQHDLPPTFGVAYFTPKDYGGLGNIDGAAAGMALNQMRAAMIARVPARVAPADLPSAVTRLAAYFREEMDKVNPAAGLRPQEVEFAVAGFADVVHKYAFSLLRAVLTGAHAPDFKSIYDGWLASGVRVLETPYAFQEGGRNWQVRIISHVYGRMGLIVQADDTTHYLYDPALTCPAEGFMMGLMDEVCEKLAAALEH